MTLPANTGLAGTGRPAAEAERPAAGVIVPLPAGRPGHGPSAVPGPALYCVHPVSGSVYPYLGLARLLGPTRPVRAIQASGIDDEIPPFTSPSSSPSPSLVALAEAYAVLVRRDRPGPYQLLGWSMGGVVAFEMARLLRAAGEPVSALILVDAFVPSGIGWPDDDDPAMIEVARHFLRDLLGTADALPPQVEATLAAWGPEAGFDDLAARIERGGLLPPELDADVLVRRYRVFRANLRALFEHRVSGRYPGRATLVRASRTPCGSGSWQSHTSDLETFTLCGDHYSIWHGAALAELGQIVGSRLAVGQAPVGQAPVGPVGPVGREQPPR